MKDFIKEASFKNNLTEQCRKFGRELDDLDSSPIFEPHVQTDDTTIEQWASTITEKEVSPTIKYKINTDDQSTVPSLKDLFKTITQLQNKIKEQDVKVKEQDVKIKEQDVKIKEQDVKVKEQDVKAKEQDVKITQLLGNAVQNDIKFNQLDDKDFYLQSFHYDVPSRCVIELYRIYLTTIHKEKFSIYTNQIKKDSQSFSWSNFLNSIQAEIKSKTKFSIIRTGNGSNYSRLSAKIHDCKLEDLNELLNSTSYFNQEEETTWKELIRTVIINKEIIEERRKEIEKLCRQ